MEQKHRAGRRGSLTVEAALILPFVLISWLTIINLLNIYYLQACIQQALNNTAQRVSEYCYLLARTDTLDDVSDLLAMSATTAQKSSTLKNGVTEMGTRAQNIGRMLDDFSLTQLPALIDETTAFAGSAKTVYGTLKTVSAEDLKDYFVSELSNAGTGIVAGAFVNSYIKDLKVSTKNISALDYTKSKFLYGKDQEFTLVVTYTYHNPLAFRFFPDQQMMQMVTMRPWIGADGTGLKELVK